MVSDNLCCTGWRDTTSEVPVITGSGEAPGKEVAPGPLSPEFPCHVFLPAACGFRIPRGRRRRCQGAGHERQASLPRRPAILTWPVEPRSRWTQPRDESECVQRSDGGLRLNSDRRLARAGRYGSARGGHILTETIEFSVSCSSEECMPFARCKSENRTFGVLTVANTDLAIRQACHLDAVAIGETQGALDPG